MEDYATKMALKPDAALRDYVANYAQYQEAAVLAALDELRRRGQPVPEESTLRPQLEAAVQEVRAAEAATQNHAAPTAEAEANLPVLYAPGAIVLFSVLFHFVSGAVLLALNFRRQGRGRDIWRLVVFVLGYMVIETMLVQVLLRQHVIGSFSPLLLSLLNLPAILAYVFWFWPRYVGTYQFRSRNWVVPLLVCFVVVVLINLWLLRELRQTPEGAELLRQIQHV